MPVGNHGSLDNRVIRLNYFSPPVMEIELVQEVFSLIGLKDFYFFIYNFLFCFNAGYVKTALGEWLPSQDEFDQFASKMAGKRLKQTLHGSDNNGVNSKTTR